MARSIDQVQNIFLAIPGLILESDRLQLYGDPFFPFQVHFVEELIPHFPLAEGAGNLQEAVGQSRFAVIDMGYYTEIADTILQQRNALHIIDG